MPHEEESWFRNGGLSTSYSIHNSVLQTDGVNAASRDEACIASGVCPAEAEVRTLSQSNTIQNIWNLGLRRAASTGQSHVMFSQMDPNGGIKWALINPYQSFLCADIQQSSNLLWQVKPRASCRRSHRCCKCSCNGRNPLSICTVQVSDSRPTAFGTSCSCQRAFCNFPSWSWGSFGFLLQSSCLSWALPVLSLELFLFFFQILASPQAIPVAIPWRYPSGT